MYNTFSTFIKNLAYVRLYYSLRKWLRYRQYMIHIWISNFVQFIWSAVFILRFSNCEQAGHYCFSCFLLFYLEHKYNLDIWIAFMKFEYNTQYWLNCFRCQVVMVSFPLSPSLTQSRLAWEWPCHSTVAASMLPLQPAADRRLEYILLNLEG